MMLYGIYTGLVSGMSRGGET